MTLFVVADVVADGSMPGGAIIKGALTDQKEVLPTLFDYMFTIKRMTVGEIEAVLEQVAYDPRRNVGAVRNVKGVPGGVYVFPIASAAVIDDQDKIVELLMEYFPNDFIPEDEVPKNKVMTRVLH